MTDSPLSSDRPFLTIGIQAGGSPDRAIATVHQLASQCPSGVEIVLIDDLCEPPVQSLLADVCRRKQEPGIRVLRNRAKFGEQLCWLRVFEHAQGEWLWTVDPEDDLREDALATVLTAARENADAVFIALAEGPSNSSGSTRQFNSAASFLEHCGGLLKLSEPSLSLFHRSKIIGNLHLAYRFAYCGSAHLSWILGSIKGDEATAISGTPIAGSLASKREKPKLSQSLEAYVGLGVLPELSFKLDARRKLRQLLLDLAHGPLNEDAFWEALSSTVRSPGHHEYVRRTVRRVGDRFFCSELPMRTLAATKYVAEPALDSVRPGSAAAGKLTVGIPTYNRPEQILRTVEALLPQVAKHGVQLLVLDNASETSVESILAPLLARWPQASVRVVLNATNIGAGPNILRLFETCDTEWLWTLGDDDRLADDAVGKILRTLQAHPEAAYISFASLNACHPIRTKTLVATGLRQGLERTDYLGSLLFLSACAYRVERILPHLQLAHHLVYSSAPQLSVALAAMRDGDTVVISDELVVEEIAAGTPEALQSTSLYPAMGISALLDIECDDECQRLLAAHLGRTTAGWLTLPGVTYNLLMTAASTGNIEQCLVQFDATKRLYALSADPLMPAKLILARWMVGHPQLAASVGNAFYKLVKGRQRDTSLYTREGAPRS